MRAKCVCKSRLNTALHLHRVFQGSVKGRRLLFLKSPRPALQVPITDMRKLLLHTLIQHVQNARKGDLPENFLDVLGPSTQRTLSLSDPAVQWISFLLRDGKGTPAIRVFSTFLHRGHHFSPQAIKHLCENASLLRSPEPATKFAEYISTTGHSKDLVETLVQTLYTHKKYEAVLSLGSLVLAKNGVAADPTHYRRIIQSMFKVHGMNRRMNPENNVSAVKGLLSILGDWLQAFKRDGHYLTQIDVIILVKQLFSLLQKQHRRERPVPRTLHLWVLSLVERLSQHLSDPLAKLTFAEACLNSFYAAYKRGKSPFAGNATTGYPVPIYRDIIRWTEAWRGKPLPSKVPVTMDGQMLEQITMKSRALKILVMDRALAGDKVTAMEHIQEITALQPAMSLLHAGRQNEAVAAQMHRRARQYTLDARLRYTSTIVRVCSHYLRKQELAPLFLVLSFTVHINDLATFVRLWKRSLHLVTQKGHWGGTFGLDALLALLAQSIPPLWGKAVVGGLLFTSLSSQEPSSSLPNLLEATLRVALLDSSLQMDRTTDERRQDTNQLVVLAQENPQAFRRWKDAVFSFTGPLPLPWKHVITRVAGVDSDEKTRLERSLLNRMAREKK